MGAGLPLPNRRRPLLTQAVPTGRAARRVLYCIVSGGGARAGCRPALSEPALSYGRRAAYDSIHIPSYPCLRGGASFPIPPPRCLLLSLPLHGCWYVLVLNMPCCSAVSPLFPPDARPSSRWQPRPFPPPRFNFGLNNKYIWGCKLLMLFMLLLLLLLLLFSPSPRRGRASICSLGSSQHHNSSAIPAKIRSVDTRPFRVCPQNTYKNHTHPQHAFTRVGTVPTRHP